MKLEDGIKQQNSDLAQWQKILTAEAYTELLCRVWDANSDIVEACAERGEPVTGHDVPRGDAILQMVLNIKNRS